MPAFPWVPFITTTSLSRNRICRSGRSTGHDRFIRQACQYGSSVGVLARTVRTGISAASCELAFRYDHKLLIELGLNGAREIECAVLEESGGQISASELGEIVPASKQASIRIRQNTSTLTAPLCAFPPNSPRSRPSYSGACG